MKGQWRRFRFLIVMLLLLLETGCWDRIELNDLALIMAVGIDHGKDGNIEVSAQILNPRAAVTTGANEQITILRTGAGKDLSQAIDRLQEKTSRRLFWGHSKVIVLGEKNAQSNFLPQIDYLIRSPQPRNSAYFYICNGKAKDILATLPPLERYSGEDLREISALQIIPGITQKDFRQNIMGKGRACYLPLVSIETSKLKEGKVQRFPTLAGFAVIKKGLYIGKFHGKPGQMKDVVSWMRNDNSAKSEITLKPKGHKEPLTVRVTKSKIKIRAFIEQDKWIVKVDPLLKVTLLQDNQLDLMNPKESKLLEEEVKKEIMRRFTTLFQDIQKQYKADIFNFATEFHRHYPHEFDAIEENWDDKFATLVIQVNPKVKVERPGLAEGPTYCGKWEGKR